jgi:hypothetical protein
MMKDWSTIPGCIVGGVPTLSCLPPLIASVVYLLLTGAGTVALFMIIYAGIKFITSGGDAKSVDGARKTLTYALIGLIVVLMSFVIVSLISKITGVTSLTSFNFK